MRKHFLLWALLLSCTLPSFAHDFYVDGIFYYKLSDSTVAVTYQGTSVNAYNNEYIGDIVIPNSVSYHDVTYAVTTIGGYAFQDCNAVTSIVLPHTITHIQAYAFRYCSALTSVNLPDNLLSIGNEAFRSSSLTSISLPNSLISMGMNVFTGSSIQYNIYGDIQYLGNADNPYLALITVNASRTTYTIHENTKVIANNAFYQSSLTSITIPEGVVALGDKCFYDCFNLSSITLPSSLLSIGTAAFYACSSLRTIVIPDKVTSIAKQTFYACNNLRTIILPKSLITIGIEAFESCSALPDITIPSNVNRLGSNAFYQCTGLSSITVEAINPPIVDGQYTLMYINSTPLKAVVTVPCASLFAYRSAYGWSNLGIDSFFDYTFNVVSGNTEHGAVAITQEPTCENGCEAIIEATANQGYQFSAWNDGNTENPRTVTITEDMTYTATFEAVKVESITLNHTEATVNKGETLQLEANILPLNAQNKNVIWASDNSAVASVSDGVITAQEKGTATIKAITADGGKLATCQVTVIAGITSFTLDETEVTLAPKTNTVLTPIFTPEDADLPAITWASEDTNIAIVSNGRVVALSVGQTIVTATTVDGAFTASCLVKVETPVTSITINPASLTLNPGDAEQLTATVLPEDATNKNYTWSSDNENVAMMIDGGWVVALESGIAYITATTENGYKTATCRVIVGEVPDSITNEIVIIPGETTADFSWPAVKDALSYIFIIYADAAKTEKICTLTFDEQGYLVRIDFLRKPSAANNTQRGFNFLVTGLDRATTYGYTLDSYSDTNTVLDRKVGQFTTLGNVATQVETSFMASPDKVSKVLENGTIYIIRNGEKYTIDGRKVSIM